MKTHDQTIPGPIKEATDEPNSIRYSLTEDAITNSRLPCQWSQKWINEEMDRKLNDPSN